jgi:MinD-like ATPase involved in chromosome partitioning or flagellar assembly
VIDQADTLRRLMGKRVVSADRVAEPRVFTISGCRGGVGVSSIVANVGKVLAQSGYSVLLVDGGSGLTKLQHLFGVYNSVRPEDVDDLIPRLAPNIRLFDYSGLSPEMHEHTLGLLRGYRCRVDVVIVDAGVVTGESKFSFHNPIYENVVILTSESSAITEACDLIQSLRRRASIMRCGVIVNQVTDGRAGIGAWKKLKELVGQRLGVDAAYLGHCIYDEKYTEAVMKRKILLELVPGAPSVSCLRLLAKSMSVGMVDAPGRFRKVLAQVALSGVQESAHGNTADFFGNLLSEVKA